MDSIPIFSQLKSLVQVISGQVEEARITQENFSRQCVGVSQVRSLVEVIAGDEQGARDTQMAFLKTTSDIVSSIPVAGHIKGGIHYALNDKEGGDAAMKSASHYSAVAGGAIAGMAIGGPVGAAALGASAGAAMDGITTGVDSAIHGEFKPYGASEAFEDPSDAGKWVDAVGGIAVDAISPRGIKTKYTLKAAKGFNIGVDN